LAIVAFMPEPIDIATIVRNRMDERGLNVNQVANGCGLSRQTVGNFVLHGSSLQADKLAKVLAFLDLTITPKSVKK
jgi:transcriptional regulator with XRE-family HTH domain